MTVVRSISYNDDMMDVLAGNVTGATMIWHEAEVAVFVFILVKEIGLESEA